MAKSIQHYPKIEDEKNLYYGYLDITKLNDHKIKIPLTELKTIIGRAITEANKKSSRALLNLPENINEDEKHKIYRSVGKSLFNYFVKYCGDPAATAQDCMNKSYEVVAREQFRNRTLQKERMNSGWRYQFIAKDTATKSGRFISVSDIGTAEADFNAVVGLKKSTDALNIYVSIKNRSNTMGGQDWPKAIHALEDVARKDKNRTGAYICVFGIAMEKGDRNIKGDSKTGNPHSSNTEIWYSDFFWPFFSNFSYEEIIKAVLGVLQEQKKIGPPETEIPIEVLNTFGEICASYDLLDDRGYFKDAYRLVELFIGKLKK